MYCKKCGAWLGEEDVLICKECGADFGGDMAEKGGWQKNIEDVVRTVIMGTVETAKDIIGEVGSEAKAETEKRLLKKGKKMTNNILKEVGLKPKGPIDVLKKTAKKTVKKMKK